MNLLFNIKSKISQITKKGLFKDTSWMLVSRLINVIFQAIYFVLLARWLGVDNYGSFVGITALASLIFPFVSLGVDDVLVKEVSVNRELIPSYWGNTLLVLTINSILITSCLFLMSQAIFPAQISWLTIIFLLLADLLGLGLQESSNKAMRALGLVHKAAQLIVLNTICKLLAVLILIWSISNNYVATDIHLVVWSGLYFGSSVVVACLALQFINKTSGGPKLNLTRIKSDIAQGIYFSLGMSASNINNNIDKTMLTSMASLNATGMYGSAYRFINIGDVPMLALFNASYPRFFQQGFLGWDKCLKFAKKLLPIILVYGAISFWGFQIIAPVVPKVLGPEYQNTITTLRWLAPLPFINALQLLFANTLTGLGFQRTRSAVQVAAAILNVLLNLFLIPLYGLYGAIYATLCSDGIRMLGLGITLFYLYRKSRSGHSK